MYIVYNIYMYDTISSYMTYSSLSPTYPPPPPLTLQSLQQLILIVLNQYHYHRLLPYHSIDYGPKQLHVYNITKPFDMELYTVNVTMYMYILTD